MVKRGIVLFIFCFVFSGCSFFTQRIGQVEIISPTKTILHPLTKNSVIEVDGKISKVVVEVKNRQVRVINSDCPDKICIKTGWISSGFQFILCAPNQVSIRIRLYSNQVDHKITY